jgi:transposase
MAQRRSFSAALKAKVAIEAIRGQKTLSEIASQYEVHPNRVWQWRKLALEKLAEVMADGRGSQSTIKQVVDVEKLHEKIGRQAVEIDFLKKKLRQLDMLDE